MRCCSVMVYGALLAGLGGGLGGCLPSSDRQLDEQKDPHFLNGKSHVNTLNYRAAVESFEKALEANPRSASAHFELGLLYEQKISEENAPAIAIYHYDKFLQLRPKSEHAEIVRQRILACKQEIAKPIALAPGTQSVLRDLERLRIDNAQLRAQVEAWQAYAAGRGSNSPTIPVTPPRPLPQTTSSQTPGTVSPAPPSRPPAPAAARKHVVQAGETPVAIARKYGISVNALMAANPGVDPRRLKIGQALYVPSP